METVEYAPGRLMDLFGDPARRAVLLWHGQQADARAAVRPLAGLLAGHGLRVLVPDWSCYAEDGGRADLLRSLDFARERAAEPGGIVLVGWSLGGTAAAGLAVHADRYGGRLARTVCLAGAFVVPDPITGMRPDAELAGAEDRCPITVLHGSFDEVVPLGWGREFAAALDRNGWPVELAELAADHGSIAGAVYDRRAGRYAAAEDDATLAITADVAARIAAGAL